MFEPVESDFSFPAQERALLEFWEKERIFQLSVEQSRGKPLFTVYEGPPTANNEPHMGHVLTRTGKDVFLRYHTMCGFHVPRRLFPGFGFKSGFLFGRSGRALVRCYGADPARILQVDATAFAIPTSRTRISSSPPGPWVIIRFAGLRSRCTSPRR